MNGEKALTFELLRVTTDLGFLIVVGLVLTKKRCDEEEDWSVK